jgi:carbohydrate-selective porin OprB
MRQIKTYKRYYLFALFFCFIYSACFARDIALEIPQLCKSWKEKYECWCEDIAKKYGTDFALLFNFRYLAALESKDFEHRGKPAWYYDLAIEQDIWKGGLLVLEMEGGRGDGLDKFLPTFSVIDDNAGEPGTVYLPKLFIQQDLFDRKLYCAAGRLDVSDWFDCNAAANSGDIQFLSTSLINNSAIPFPQKGMGAMVGFRPGDWVYLQAGAADARARSSKPDFRSVFSGNLQYFIINEVGFLPKIKQRSGNYRFAWNCSLQDNERFDETGKESHDWGFSFSFDQEITGRIILFLRYGWADKRVRKISSFWSTGAQVTGLIPGRKDDYLGFGVAQSIMGGDYRKASGDDASRTETLFEMYYNVVLHEYVRVSPVFQFILNPNATKHVENDVVLGGRLLIMF